MAADLRGAAVAGTGASGVGATFTFPSNTQPGDIVLVLVVVAAGSSTLQGVSGGPISWQILGNSLSSNGVQSLFLLGGKVPADATFPLPDVTVSWTTSNRYLGNMVVLSGAGALADLQLAVSARSTSFTPLTAAPTAFTPVAKSGRVVHLLGTYGGTSGNTAADWSTTSPQEDTVVPILAATILRSGTATPLMSALAAMDAAVAVGGRPVQRQLQISRQNTDTIHTVFVPDAALPVGTLSVVATVAVTFSAARAPAATLNVAIGVAVTFSGQSVATGRLDVAAAAAVTFSGTGRTVGTFDVATTVAVQFITTYLPDDVPTINPADAPHLAVEVRADLADETFTLDVSELDGDDVLDWGLWEEGGWANVVCDVTSASSRRGVTRMQGPRTRAEAGTLHLVLTDTERRFDPIAGMDAIGKGTPIRLRAWDVVPITQPDGTVQMQRWSEVLITAKVSDVNVQYVEDSAPIVTVDAVDVIGELAGTQPGQVDAPGEGEADTLGDRVARLIDRDGRDLMRLSDDVDTAFVATLAPSQLSGSAWDLISAAADAELGQVWADRTNLLVVHNRDRGLDGPIRGTFSDSHEEVVAGPVHCCYRDPVVQLGADNVVNTAQAQRRAWEQSGPGVIAPQVRTAEDLPSQYRYGALGPSGSSGVVTLELRRDVEVQQWVDQLVAAQATPEVRVDTVAPAPENYPAAWPHLCRTDLGDRWWFRMRPAVADPVDRMLGVLGISHEITPDGWTVQLVTGDAPAFDVEDPDGWFTLNASQLDGPDVLIDYAGEPDTWDVGPVDGGTPDDVPRRGRRVDGGSIGAVWDRAPIDGGTMTQQSRTTTRGEA